MEVVAPQHRARFSDFLVVDQRGGHPVIMAAADEQIDDLHKKYRLIEGDRKAFSEEGQQVLRRQRANIDKLKGDNQQLKEELCSDEFVESLLADYAKDIPVTSAIQVCTSYWPLRLPLTYSLPTDPCVLPTGHERRPALGHRQGAQVDWPRRWQVWPAVRRRGAAVRCAPPAPAAVVRIVLVLAAAAGVTPTH